MVSRSLVPQFVLRPAQASDLELAYQVTREAMRDAVEQTWGPWLEMPQRAMHAQKFTPATHRFIVVEDLVAGLIAVDEDPDCVWLQKIYLNADWRGKGIGSSLISAVIADANRRNKPVQLRVLRVNEGARRLYERHGFTVIEEQPERYVMRREAGRPAAVTIEPWSTEWAAEFARLRDALKVVLQPATMQIEHIGSTSVQGLAAKPVIDILLGAASLADLESNIEALAGIGFEYVPKYEDELPMRRYFVKSQEGGLRVHLHGVVIDSTLWREHLVFRDALCRDTLLREQYQALKLQLAAHFAHDKSAYSAAKGPFIRSVMTALQKG